MGAVLREVPVPEGARRRLDGDLCGCWLQNARRVPQQMGPDGHLARERRAVLPRSPECDRPLRDEGDEPALQGDDEHDGRTNVMRGDVPRGARHGQESEAFAYAMAVNGLASVKFALQDAEDLK